MGARIERAKSEFRGPTTAKTPNQHGLRRRACGVGHWQQQQQRRRTEPQQLAAARSSQHASLQQHVGGWVGGSSHLAPRSSNPLGTGQQRAQLAPGGPRMRRGGEEHGGGWCVLTVVVPVLVLVLVVVLGSLLSRRRRRPKHGGCQLSADEEPARGASQQCTTAAADDASSPAVRRPQAAARHSPSEIVAAPRSRRRRRPAKNHRAVRARRGGQDRHRSPIQCFHPSRFVTGPSVRRPTLPCALSPGAPNAHWPAASLVLAPILNLQGRSR
jgi:hypothetical protein